MRVLCAMALLLGCWLYDPIHTIAHSAEEVMKAFDRGPIPKELLEATENLEATAGQRSTRQDAHERQHELLEHYVRAGKERKCTEAMADIFKFDSAIVDFLNQADVQEENAFRQVRDDTAAFVKAECTDTSVNKSVPRQ